MSAASLQTKIKEDHLTCAICCESFTRPKALPCIHTFCESCLRDYVVSRGYESAGTFPCPLCRVACAMPSQGVEGFPNNHLMSSLSDTVDKAVPRPVPKPRRSLGNLIDGGGGGGEGTDVDNNMPKAHSYNGNQAGIECSSGPDNFEVIDGIGGDGTSVDSSPPPPYSSVADAKVCSNDDSDAGWMLVPKQNPSEAGQCNHRSFSPPSCPPNTFPASATTPYDRQHYNPQPIIGWNVPNLPPVADMQSDIRRNEQFATDNNSALYPNAALYPSVPYHLSAEDTASCSENLMLRFGKQGSTPRDFIKPSGLAVSRDGHYVISDSGGDQNRIMIFNSGGEIKIAFKCGAKVKDIAVTQNNDIIASIDKNTSAVRHFTMGGQLKGEFGKFFTYEKPGGIAELKNRGVVLTGIDGNCVYVLTQQMKISTKFGRKGNGDGYFLHPAFVAVDSKNHVIVTDKMNGCVQVFSSEGKFKHRFGSIGHSAGQLQEPMGVCADSMDNIIVADSGNFRVEVFSPSGKWLTSVVKDTFQLGENVKPVNVAVTPTGKVAVLLCGPYFVEVRVYASKHQQIPQEGPVSIISSVWYSK